MGLLGALAATNINYQNRLHGSIQNFTAEQQKVKIKRGIQEYLGRYGTDLSEENFRELFKNDPEVGQGVMQMMANFQKTQPEKWETLSSIGGQGRQRNTKTNKIESFGSREPVKTFSKIPFYDSKTRQVVNARSLEEALRFSADPNKSRGTSPAAKVQTTDDKIKEAKALIAAGVKTDPTERTAQIIKTVDDDGNPIQKAVVPKVGDVYEPQAKPKSIASEKLKIIEKWKSGGSLTGEQKRFIGIDKPLQGEMTEPAATKLFSDLGLMHGLMPEDVAKATQFFITKKAEGKTTKAALFETLDEIKDISLMSQYETAEDLKNSSLPVSEKIRIGKKKWPNRFR